LLELDIVEDTGIICLVEYEIEIGVIYDILYLADILFIVAIADFEAELEVLIVKYANIGLRVVPEGLDHTRLL
jgi:hypothetical protein